GSLRLDGGERRGAERDAGPAARPRVRCPARWRAGHRRRRADPRVGRAGRAGAADRRGRAAPGRGCALCRQGSADPACYRPGCDGTGPEQHRDLSPGDAAPGCGGRTNAGAHRCQAVAASAQRRPVHTGRPGAALLDLADARHSCPCGRGRAADRSDSAAPRRRTRYGGGAGGRVVRGRRDLDGRRRPGDRGAGVRGWGSPPGGSDMRAGQRLGRGGQGACRVAAGWAGDRPSGGAVRAAGDRRRRRRARDGGGRPAEPGRARPRRASPAGHHRARADRCGRRRARQSDDGDGRQLRSGAHHPVRRPGGGGRDRQQLRARAPQPRDSCRRCTGAADQQRGRDLLGPRRGGELRRLSGGLEPCAADRRRRPVHRWNLDDQLHEGDHRAAGHPASRRGVGRARRCPGAAGRAGSACPRRRGEGGGM
ncbi:MAG: Histidinol dehydrogenase, partial [uncultured Sphingomonas sp.]